MDPLTRLRNQAEDEGNEPGSPQFEFRFLVLKVEKCMEGQSVTLCADCKVFFDCEMTKEHERWKKFGPPGAGTRCGSTSGGTG